MGCQKCGSKRVLFVSGKCNDLCFVEYDDVEKDGYVPDHLGIGGGDYIEIEVCMECGQLQGEWPKDDESIKERIMR
jgi:hypothetical protein